MQITIEAALVWIGDEWNGETVVNVSNNPVFPLEVNITLRPADTSSGDPDHVVMVRRDALIAVDRYR